MVNGIPFFGEEQNNIVKKIKESKISKEISIGLYEFIQQFGYENTAVYIIDNQYFSWVNDTKFNYRDKEVYIPYFTYKLYSTGKKRRSDNKGHIIRDKDNYFSIRYEYKVCKKVIGLGTEVEIYDFSTESRIKVIFTDWIKDSDFSIERLYNLYLVSCYREDDFYLNKHLGGYHYIDKTVEKFSNVERNLRREYNLLDFAEDNVFFKGYRDVREFKFEEVFSKESILSQSETYKIRRLNFESYLYCILRKHLEPIEIDFKKEWLSLTRGKNYIKYGNKIKLIIKNYWLDDSNYKNTRTWSRV